MLTVDEDAAPRTVDEGQHHPPLRGRKHNHFTLDGDRQKPVSGHAKGHARRDVRSLQSAMRRRVLTRPTWQTAPHCRANAPHIAIVCSFHSVEPPTKIPIRGPRNCRTSGGRMPSCTAIRTTTVRSSSHPSQRRESSRLAIPPMTISGATTKSARAPISATARRNASSSNSVPFLKALHAPLSSA